MSEEKQGNKGDTLEEGKKDAKSDARIETPAGPTTLSSQAVVAAIKKMFDEFLQGLKPIFHLILQIIGYLTGITLSAFVALLVGKYIISPSQAKYPWNLEWVFLFLLLLYAIVRIPKSEKISEKRKVHLQNILVGCIAGLAMGLFTSKVSPPPLISTPTVAEATTPTVIPAFTFAVTSTIEPAETETPTFTLQPITPNTGTPLPNCPAVGSIPKLEHISPNNAREVRALNNTFMQTILATAISNNRELLAVATRTGLCLYNLTAGGVPYYKPFDNRVDRIVGAAFSPDSSILAVAMADFSVVLYTIEQTNTTGLSIYGMQTITGHQSKIINLGFSSPNGDTLATLDDTGILLLWQRTPNEYKKYSNCPQVSETQTRITSFEFYPTRMDQLAYGRADGKVVVFNTEICDWSLIYKAGGVQIYDLAFSADGRWLAAGDEKNAWLWDTRVSAPGVWLSHNHIVYSVNFDPDGRLLIAGDENGGIKLWQVGTADHDNPLRTFSAHSGRIYCVGFSPDGTLIASGGSDGYVKIWGVPLLGTPTP